MLGRLRHVTADDIESLISESVAEGKQIDYKREMSGNSDSEKKELLADMVTGQYVWWRHRIWNRRRGRHRLWRFGLTSTLTTT